MANIFTFHWWIDPEPSTQLQIGPQPCLRMQSRLLDNRLVQKLIVLRHDSKIKLVDTVCAYNSGVLYFVENTSWKNLLAYMDHAFLVAIAYIDPDNFQIDVQSGVQYKYGLLWIILVSCDIPEVIGTTFACSSGYQYDVLFLILITGLSTLVFYCCSNASCKARYPDCLSCPHFVGCFFAELGYSKPTLFVSQLKDNGQLSRLFRKSLA